METMRTASLLSPTAVIHCSSVCDFGCLLTSRQRNWVTDDFTNCHLPTYNSHKIQQILYRYFSYCLLPFLPSCSLSAVNPALLRHSGGGALMCRTPPHQWRGRDKSVKSAQHNKAHMATSARRWCCVEWLAVRAQVGQTENLSLASAPIAKFLFCLFIFLSWPIRFLETVANKRDGSCWCPQQILAWSFHLCTLEGLWLVDTTVQTNLSDFKGSCYETLVFPAPQCVFLVIGMATSTPSY